MCTLTWNRDETGGLVVYFNRDELKARPVADPPAFYEEGGVSFLSPRDPAGGGTWMLANERGMIICLLNKWELEVRPPAGRRSRGRLVWAMAGVGSLNEIEEFLTDLESYPAFTLVAFSEEEERGWDWDGIQLSSRSLQMPVTSSSFCFEEVKAAREAIFKNGLRGADYHSAKGQEASAFTVRMCRADAQTWSRSIVRLGRALSWEYWAEQPGLDGEPERTFLELARR